MDKLRGHISGLAVPQFVIDAPGGGGKIPLLPNYVISRDEDKIILRNYKYNVYEYPDVRDESKVTEKDVYLRKQKRRRKVLDEKELISNLKIPVTNN